MLICWAVVKFSLFWLNVMCQCQFNHKQYHRIISRNAIILKHIIRKNPPSVELFEWRCDVLRWLTRWTYRWTCWEEMKKPHFNFQLHWVTLNLAPWSGLILIPSETSFNYIFFEKCLSLILSVAFSWVLARFGFLLFGLILSRTSQSLHSTEEALMSRVMSWLACKHILIPLAFLSLVAILMAMKWSLN